MTTQPDAVAAQLPATPGLDTPVTRKNLDGALAAREPPRSPAARTMPRNEPTLSAQAPGAASLRRVDAVTMPFAPQDREPAPLSPSPSPSISSHAHSAASDIVPAPAPRPRITRVAMDNRRAAPALPQRGMPAAQPAPVTRSPGSASAARQDISVLLAPAPTPPRRVFIDRVSVTVQAPVPPPAPATQSAPAAARSAARAAAPAAYRNPWSSYHARRD